MIIKEVDVGWLPEKKGYDVIVGGSRVSTSPHHQKLHFVPGEEVGSADYKLETILVVP